MDKPIVTARSLISEITVLAPQTIPLLVQLRLNCVGCSMARFCTVEEAAAQYSLDLPVFLDSIQQVIGRVSQIC